MEGFMKNVLIVGSGYRSMFYLRVIKAMPKEFRLVAMLTRSKETAREVSSREGIIVKTNPEEFFNADIDLVIVASSKTNIAKTALLWASKGFKVLMETPAGINEEDFNCLLSSKYKNNIMVAEQYHRYPSLQALKKVLDRGIIGDILDLKLSLCHDYHAISLMRFFLGDLNNPKLLSKAEYSLPILETGNRAGIKYDGDIKDYKRAVAVFEFENNRHATYDFSSLLYHTEIATSSLRIQGSLGEYIDGALSYAIRDESGIYNFKKEELETKVDIETNEIRAIRFNNEDLWTNDYLGLGFNNDEIGIADFLMGKASYSLEDAVFDARLGLLIH